MKCILLSNYTKESTNNAGIEYKYLAILYGYLDRCLFCAVKRNLFDRLATLTLSGAVFNNCTIVLGSQPSAPQVLAAIPAKRRRYRSKSDDENES